MLKRILQWIGRAIVRLYAFGLVLVLAYVFYLAVAYLVALVFAPLPVPEKLLDWPGRLEARSLREPNVPGITEPAARAPLAHYHKVDQWLQLDPHNGCTQAGCHEPLPHTKQVYVRAFANFHATFLTCNMCHEQPAAKPMQAHWVDLRTGRPQERPPLLELLDLLATQTQKIEQEPANVQEPVLALLEQVLDINDDPIVEYLRLQIETAEPGSPVWRQAMADLADELPQHARGQYGAKIAPAGEPTYLQLEEQMQELADDYFGRQRDAAARKQVQDAIHAKVVARPDRCLACHGEAPPLVDFAALGYPAERAEFLRSVPLAQQVQGVREGRPFILPQIREEPR